MAARLSLLLCCVAAGKADLERGIAATYVDNGLVSSHTAVVDGASIKYLQAGSLDAPKVLLFCHGAAFSARTWQIVGALDAAASQGMAAVAIDLPGYNGSERPRSVSREHFLGRFAEAIGVRAGPDRGLLVVSASMGGTYALPFVLSPGPFHVAGYLTAAGSTAALAGQRSAVPALFLFGDQDPRLAQDRAPYESAFARSQTIVFANAPHPCYLRDVAAAHEFVDLLLEFAGGHAVRHLDESLKVRAAWGDKERELSL